MVWIRNNQNPEDIRTSDCVYRAIAMLERKPWEEIYMDLSVQGLMMHRPPIENSVWGAYLKKKGYKQKLLPDTCPDCYTIADFCKDYPHGEYLLATGTHVVCVIDGNHYDTWDSSQEIPIFYWEKEKKE